MYGSLDVVKYLVEHPRLNKTIIEDGSEVSDMLPAICVCIYAQPQDTHRL